MTAPLATMIDLTRLSRPLAIEDLDFKILQSAFMTRFVAEWTAQRAKDPTLPPFDVGNTRSDSVVLASRAFSYVRLLDRTRVNDAVAAVLAPLAEGADLDNVVARLGVERLVLIRATETEPVVMESDERLLRRYLLAFSRPSAGSAARYLYEALTAWPQLLEGRYLRRHQGCVRRGQGQRLRRQGPAHEAIVDPPFHAGLRQPPATWRIALNCAWASLAFSG